MSVSAIPPDVVASLTDLEREVLQLLASGHTVKSIAVRLDRSEASINERLRDARRKTGVGSSRELARRLDAQKIWDRKIDLAGDDPTADPSAMLPKKGHSLSKGKIAMLITLPLAALAFALATSGGVENVIAHPEEESAATHVSPLVGDWTLDVARIPEGERPQRVTIAFRISPDNQWTTRVEIVGPDGVVRHAQSTALADGIAVPVSGNMGIINSSSLRQPAANTLVMSLGKDGAPVSTRVYTVAKDGKTMTETIIWPGESVPKMETTYFSRIG